MLRSLAGVLAGIFVCTAFAQDDAVVVTATRFADSKRNLPVGVTVITAVSVDVQCPACGKSHTVSVPKGTEGNLTVERAAGLEPEVGGSG